MADLGELSFADWSGMGQPAVTVNPGGFSIGAPSAAAIGGGFVSGGIPGALGGALSSAINYSPASYSIGGASFSPAGSGGGGGGMSFGTGADVSVSGGQPTRQDIFNRQGITYGQDGALYGANGSILMPQGGGTYRDLNTGKTLNEQEAGAILYGLAQSSMTPAGTQAITGLFQKVAGGYIPYSPTGEAVSGQIFPTLPAGGVDVTDLGIQVGGFSSSNPLNSAAPRSGSLAPTSFSTRTPSGEFTATPTGSTFTQSAEFAAELAKRSQAAADTTNFLLGEASKLDLQPLVEATRKEFASQRERLGLARDRTISNINASAVRNRLSGSSFANDAVTRAEAEFAAQERALGAQEAQQLQATRLQEIDARTQLRTKAFDVQQQVVDSTIKDLLGTSTLGTEMTRQFSSMFTALKSLEQTLAVQEAQSIRAAIFGEKQSVRQTEAAARNAEAQSEAGLFQGIGKIAGSILGGGSDSLIGGLIKSIF